MTSLFDNDGYETIPLMNDGSSHRSRNGSFSSTPSEGNSAIAFVQNNFKKIALGFIVVVVCVFLFSGSTTDNKDVPITNETHGLNNSKDFKVKQDQKKSGKGQLDEEKKFLEGQKLVDHQSNLPPVTVGGNYTDAEINEEFLSQFKHVYPNAATDEEKEEEETYIDGENEEKKETEEETDEESTTSNSDLSTHGDNKDGNTSGIVRGASILDWSLDSKKKNQEEEKNEEDESDKSNDKDNDNRNNKKRNNNKNRQNNRKRSSSSSSSKKNKKNNKKKDSIFDLSALKKALRTDSKNPFTIDYHSIIKSMSKQYPELSGDLAPSNDYSIRKLREHKGHSEETDPDLFHALRFFHISDTHIDAFFNPYQSSQQGVCASCKLNSKIYGDAAYCPLDSPFQPNILNTKSGYAFGRYRCNPPPQLLASMLANIRLHQRLPAFFLITGDIGAHGMPTDTSSVNEDSILLDFCPTKFNGMRQTLLMFRELFPHTPILFSPGNNDHLPKNKVWTPYFEAFSALLVEFDMLHPSQAETFSRIGSHYVDLEVDNVKYIEYITNQAKNSTTNANLAKKMSNGLDGIPKTTLLRAILPDMTLLAPGGEVSFVDEADYANLEGLEREDVQFPKRAELVRWLNSTLFEADKEGRTVILGGHQPLTTKKGQNELLLTSTTHGLLVKAILTQYSHIVTGSFFGHRNLASIQNIISPSGDQVIPSLVIPGVSPRGLNQPAFMELSLSRKTGKVLDFEQYVFDLMEENEHSQILTSGMRQYIPTEVLISSDNPDSGSNIVHQVIAARITDRYDPESYKKHKEEEAKEDEEKKLKEEKEEKENLEKKLKEEKENLKKDSSNDIQTTSKENITETNLVNHGLDCGDDEELCRFAQKWGYLGRWVTNPEDIASWRKMTGSKEFNAQTVFDMNSRVPTSGKLYTALQVFKRGGFVGDQSPESLWCQSLYDDEAMMQQCLFPEQDQTEGCFASSWIK